MLKNWQIDFEMLFAIILSQYLVSTKNFELKEYKGSIASLTTPCKVKIYNDFWWI